MTAFSQPERRGLERMQLSNPESHLDADLLTAFAEHGLTAREHDQVLAHLAACSSCREVAALAGSPVIEPVSEPVRKRGMWEMPLFHWGAVAATTVVVVAAVSLGVREYRSESPDLAALHREQAPVSVAQSEDKVVAAPQAKTQAVAGLSEAATPSGAPAESAPSQPKRALHLQQEARYERPSPVTGKKQEAAAAPQIGGMLADGASNGSAPASGNRDYSYTANANAVSKSGKTDLATARAAAPPATLAQNTPTSGVSGMASVEAQDGKAKKDERALAAAQVAPQAAVGNETEPGYSTGAIQKAARAKGTDFRWQIIDGKLQRAAAPNEWHTVLPTQTFRTFAVIQSHVWAGGDNALLYHSADNGQTWTSISVKGGTIALTGNIMALRFTDTQHGSLQSSTGENWTTSDGGQSWQKK